jgi:hypothetical protein
MKAKALLIGLMFVLILVATTLILAQRSDQTIQIVGDLSNREVADICAAVMHKTHPAILPDLSFPSLRAAPGLVLQRFTKPDHIFKIESRTRGFVAVFGGSQSDKWVKSHVFWSVFRQTNSWTVVGEYHVSRY